MAQSECYEVIGSRSGDATIQQLFPKSLEGDGIIVGDVARDILFAPGRVTVERRRSLEPAEDEASPPNRSEYLAIRSSMGGLATGSWDLATDGAALITAVEQGLGVEPGVVVVLERGIVEEQRRPFQPADPAVALQL